MIIVDGTDTRLVVDIICYCLNEKLLQGPQKFKFKNSGKADRYIGSELWTVTENDESLRILGENR